LIGILIGAKVQAARQLSKNARRWWKNHSAKTLAAINPQGVIDFFSPLPGWLARCSGSFKCTAQSSSSQTKTKLYISVHLANRNGIFQIVKLLANLSAFISRELTSKLHTHSSPAKHTHDVHCWKM
jgi:hypothetical protein